MSDCELSREQLLEEVARLRQRVHALEEPRRELGTCRDQDHCLAAVLEQLPVGVLLLKAPDGQVLLGNRKLQEIVGRPAEALAGLARTGNGHKAWQDGPLVQALHGQKDVPDQDVAVTRPDGSRAAVRVSVAPVRDSAGQPVAAVATVQDVTSDRRREEELRQAADRNQAIAELTSDYAYVTRVDGDGRIVMEWATPSFTRITGYTIEEWEATGGWLGHTPPEDRQAAMEAFREFMLAGDRVEGEHRLLTKDGRVLWIRYRSQAVREGGTGRLLKLVGSVEDVTERKEAERRAVHILESTTDAYFALDQEWRFTYVNQRAEQTLRRQARELRGKVVWEAFPDAAGSEFARHCRAAAMTGLPAHFEEFYGPLRTWFEVHAYPARDGLSIYFRDITERKRTEEKIQDYNQRLQRLTHRLLEVQEQERRHIARELHDEVGQLLTALKLNLDMARKILPGELGVSLDRCHRMVQNLVGRVRELSLRLRPIMLDDLGLVPALLYLFEGFSTQTHIRVNFEQQGLTQRFQPEVETAVYRIIQEALTNVARYAGVSEVAVRLWSDGAVVGAEIEDRGLGFDQERRGPRGRSGGLSGMSERATLLGGQLEIHSRPGAGTRVFVELPVGQPTEGDDEEHNGHPGGRPPDRAARVEGDPGR